MSTRMIYTAMGVWLAVVAIVAGIGSLSGIPMTTAMMLLTLVVGLMPAAIFLKLFPRGDEPQTVAQLLKTRP